ncbi:MAG: hypothetical protein IPH71_16225 [Proteobacteria bacterium]|nr:hypothetical protein [Pseudomonadota bacterium]
MALLHDGRAGTVEEAIIKHGGQAQFSRRAFTAQRSASGNNRSPGTLPSTIVLQLAHASAARSS